MPKEEKTTFGLLDCNNFYVSCERLFQPKLEQKPVLVLSNNDGCVVSRSNEAKALKIKMGIPVFKIKELIKQHDMKILSSNYTLYGDLSKRVMDTLQALVPALEIYSIDEAFLDLSGFNPSELDEVGKNIVATVFKWTGIPVSLGIGSTKTLAKAANYIAKNQKKTGGVFNIEGDCKHNFLAKIDISEIWGIGQRWTYQLNQLGIENAKQLSEQDPLYIQKRFNITLGTTVLELKGIPVQKIEGNPRPRKQIIVSRSFGKTITDPSELRESLSLYTTRALEKLRDQNSVAKSIQIFLQTNRFKDPQNHHAGITLKLPIPSQNTIEFLKAAITGLNKIYDPNAYYKKAGVILTEITDQKMSQFDFFSKSDEKATKLMALIDTVNKRMGRGVIRFGSEGFQKKWFMRSLSRSPNYTTKWSELPKVKAL